MKMVNVNARIVKMRSDEVVYPVEVFIVTLETEEGEWEEQFTSLSAIQDFLQGVKAAFGALLWHVDIPLVGKLPGGSVIIQNPPRTYWCARCGNPTARKVPDTMGWDGGCYKCGPIPQDAVLDKKPEVPPCP